MQQTISKVIMWVVWSFFAVASILSAHFLTQNIPQLNSFGKPFDVFAIGVLLFPILICAGMRFWLSRIRNPWLALLPFLIGVIFALQTGCLGYFVVREYCIVYQIFSGLLFVLFHPFFIQFAETSTKPETVAKNSSTAAS